MDSASRFIRIIGWLAVIALAINHFSWIIETSADVPKSDEWNAFNPEGLTSELNFGWLIGGNGSHRIFFTRLATWIQYHIDGYNIYNQQIINFIIYCLIIPIVARIKRRVCGVDNFPLFPFFVLFLLSPIASENHSWGYQSQFHFVLIFGLLAALIGFRNPSSKADSIWFVILVLCGVYSFSSGVGSGAALLSLFAVHRVGLAVSRKSGLTRGDFGTAATAVLIGVAGMWLWFGATPGASLFPDKLLFWQFFFNLVSLGHGVETELSLLPGIAICLVIFVTVAGLLIDKESRWQPGTWVIFAAVLSIVAALSIITLGRAGNYGSDFIQSKFSRYSEISFILVPLISILIWMAFRKRLAVRSVALVVYLQLVVAGYQNNWDFSFYSVLNGGRHAAIKCISQYLQGNGQPICMWVESKPLNKDIEYAQKLGISFPKTALSEPYKSAPAPVF